MMVDCSLGNNLSKFVNWFPNMRSLKVRNCSVDDKGLAVSFPHLKHLILESSFEPVKNELTSENAMKLLFANRQLQYLYIIPRAGATADKLLNTIKEDTSILKLQKLERFANVQESEMIRLYF